MGGPYGYEEHNDYTAIVVFNLLSLLAVTVRQESSVETAVRTHTQNL